MGEAGTVGSKRRGKGTDPTGRRLVFFLWTESGGETAAPPECHPARRQVREPEQQVPVDPVALQAAKKTAELFQRIVGIECRSNSTIPAESPTTFARDPERQSGGRDTELAKVAGTWTLRQCFWSLRM